MFSAASITIETPTRFTTTHCALRTTLGFLFGGGASSDKAFRTLTATATAGPAGPEPRGGGGAWQPFIQLEKRTYKRHWRRQTNVLSGRLEDESGGLYKLEVFFPFLILEYKTNAARRCALVRKKTEGRAGDRHVSPYVLGGRVDDTVLNPIKMHSKKDTCFAEKNRIVL